MRLEEKRSKVKEKISGALNGCVNGFELSEMIVIQGVINTRVGYVEVEEVIGMFDVPGSN
jgi:hypothetical protein